MGICLYLCLRECLWVWNVTSRPYVIILLSDNMYRGYTSSLGYIKDMRPHIAITLSLSFHPLDVTQILLHVVNIHTWFITLALCIFTPCYKFATYFIHYRMTWCVVFHIFSTVPRLDGRNSVGVIIVHCTYKNMLPISKTPRIVSSFSWYYLGTVFDKFCDVVSPASQEDIELAVFL